MTQKKYDLKKDERYLRLLAKSFPNIADAATEIINLEAIAHLPKGSQLNKVDTISILNGSHVRITQGYANNITDTSIVTSTRTHPQDIMVSPCDIPVVIVL